MTIYAVCLLGFVALRIVGIDLLHLVFAAREVNLLTILLSTVAQLLPLLGSSNGRANIISTPAISTAHCPTYEYILHFSSQICIMNVY